MVCINTCEMRGCKEGRARVFMVISIDKTGSNKHKLKLRKSHLQISENLFTLRVNTGIGGPERLQSL